MMEEVPGEGKDSLDRWWLIQGVYGPFQALARLERTIREPCATLDSLLYAALDARMLLEGTALAFGFFFQEGEISKSQSKAYRVKDHVQNLREIEPEIEKVLDFLRIYVDTAGREQPLAVPDFDRMNQYYGQIGGYLHSTVSNWEAATGEGFGEDLWKLLGEIYREMKPMVAGGFPRPKLNEKGKELLGRFLRGEAGEEQVRKELAGSVWPRPKDASR